MLERKACLVGLLEAQKAAERQGRGEERDPFSSPLDEKVSLERKGDGRAGGKGKKSFVDLSTFPSSSRFLFCVPSLGHSSKAPSSYDEESKFTISFPDESRRLILR